MSLMKDYPNTNWATATETTVVPRIFYPFSQLGDTTGIIYERDYVQAREDFSPMALDTADGTYSSAFLIEETSPQGAGTSLVSFTRRFATVPSSITSYSWRSVSFFAYYESFDASSSYRPEKSVTTSVKEVRTFTQNATGVFALTGTRYKVEKTSSNETEVQYVDANTNPTISSYQNEVTSSNYIQLSDNSIQKAYGVGNILMQTQFLAIAQ